MTLLKNLFRQTVNTPARRKVVMGTLTVLLVAFAAPPPLLALIPVLGDRMEEAYKEG